MKENKLQLQCKTFNELIPELKIDIAQSLETFDLINLTLLSKYNLRFFKPIIDVRQFLHAVTRRDLKAVEAMLQKDTSLIFKRGSVTDCSGRAFVNISAFEYAIWALDSWMWKTMLACIPQNRQGDEVFSKLMRMYIKNAKIGVKYSFNDELKMESHFDFTGTIIKQLELQRILLNSAVRSSVNITKQFIEGVGGAQRILPMHIVSEYCSEEPFYPAPDFFCPSVTYSSIHNWLTKNDENWFDSQLGHTYAVYKSRFVMPRIQNKEITEFEYWDHIIDRDLTALKALYSERNNDLIKLGTELADRVTKDVLPQKLN
jgi:hypothetical protein